MHLAMYKGPASGLLPKLAHWLICLGTWSRYSHVELVIDGLCLTSSMREGGVRGKYLNFGSGHWDIFPVPGDAARALTWFRAHKGERYDYLGVARFIPLLRWLPKRDAEWFCSEAVAAALGLPRPHTFTPAGLLRHFKG